MPIISINHIVAFLWILTSPKTGLMLKSVAVFDGGAVHYLFKNDIEVGGAVEARQLRYLVYFQVEVVQIFLCLLDANIVDIVLHRDPQLFLEQAAEIGLAYHEIVRYLPKGDVPPAEVLLDILRGRPDKIMVLARPFGLHLLLELGEEPLRLIKAAAVLKPYQGLLRRLALLHQHRADGLLYKLPHTVHIQVPVTVPAQPPYGLAETGEKLWIAFLRRHVRNPLGQPVEYRAAHGVLRGAGLLDYPLPGPQIMQLL